MSAENADPGSNKSNTNSGFQGWLLIWEYMKEYLGEIRSHTSYTSYMFISDHGQPGFQTPVDHPQSNGSASVAGIPALPRSSFGRHKLVPKGTTLAQHADQPE